MEEQWFSVREEWASERERLALAREEWEAKAKSVETTLGATAAKFDAGLASLAVLQRQQQQLQLQSQPLGLGMGNGDVKGFHGGSGSSGARGGLVTPPSPRSLSADSNRPRQRRKRSSSGRGRGRSAGSVDAGVESECSTSTTSTHPSSFGRPYTPSIPDDSSDDHADPDPDPDAAADDGDGAGAPHRKDSTDSNPDSLNSSKDSGGGGSVHQLETPESSVHRESGASSGLGLPWAGESPVTADSLESSVVRGFRDGNGSEAKGLPFDVVRPLSFRFVLFVLFLLLDTDWMACW